MDRRREPRFDVSARAKVTVFGNPELQLECSLLEISATGVELLADKSLLMDGIVGLELEDHFVLGDVRYTQPRGDKYTIGAERVYTAGKNASQQDQDPAEQMRTVVQDFHKCVRARIAGTASADTAEQGVPTLSLEQLTRLDRQLRDYFDQPVRARVPVSIQKNEPEVNAPAERIENAPAEKVAEDQAPVADRWNQDSSPTAFSHPSETQLQWRGALLPMPGSSAPPAPSVEPQATSSVEPQLETIPESSHSGVDEESTTETMLEEKATPTKAGLAEEAEEPKFSWRIPLSVAAIVTVAWSVFLFYDSSRNGNAATAPADTSVSPDGQSKRRVQIRVIQPTWIRASSDGKELFAKLIGKGEVAEIEYSEKAQVRIGNTDNVEVILNGKPIPLGDRGRIRLIELTAGNYRFLPVN